jgi:polyisoprenoid-binding protein YceI
VAIETTGRSSRSRPSYRPHDPANPAASSVEVKISVASLTTNNAQRDNDLRGSYFLELDKYPHRDLP